MGTLFSGIGLSTGMNISEVVENLVRVSARPRDQLLTRIGTIDAQLDQIGRLKTALRQQVHDRAVVEAEVETFKPILERVTADVARAIQSDDARMLANLLDMEVLQQLQTAIEPLADVRSMKFVGAVEKSGRVLAAYVAGGKTSDGTDVLVGFVLNVTGDQIVGVN